jgi:hypothetical protein
VNVEIGTEVAQFLCWEYINGIFVAVYRIEKGLTGKGCSYGGGGGIKKVEPSIHVLIPQLMYTIEEEKLKGTIFTLL